MKIISVVVVMFAIALGTPRTAAADTFWSSVGAGCHMEPASESIGAIDYTSGIVFFTGSNTGTIHLVCPVTKAGVATNPNFMDIQYSENHNDCSITAYFKRTTTGTSPSAGSIASVISTNHSGLWVASQGFTHTFSLDDNYYWMDVYVTRTSTNCDPWFYGVRLYYSS